MLKVIGPMVGLVTRGRRGLVITPKSGSIIEVGEWESEVSKLLVPDRSCSVAEGDWVQVEEILHDTDSERLTWGVLFVKVRKIDPQEQVEWDSPTVHQRGTFFTIDYPKSLNWEGEYLYQLPQRAEFRCLPVGFRVTYGKTQAILEPVKDQRVIAEIRLDRIARWPSSWRWLSGGDQAFESWLELKPVLLRTKLRDEALASK